MCGRFVLATPPATLIQRFGLTSCVDFIPRYNIAPMTNIVVIRQSAEGERTGEFHRWGLLPGWAKDPTLAAKLNNARGETVNEKASFRTAFRRSRCIIPGDGFYEWKPVDENGRTVKQPYYIRPKEDGELIRFAGLTERWTSPTGEEILSCCIVTIGPNAVMEPIHDRMPVILSVEDEAAWLDPHNTNPDMLKRFIRPANPENMMAFTVSRAVNSSRNESPDLIAPV
jgi:putative SOS response-associated peptidase YedK